MAETHFAPSTALSVPAAIAPTVRAVGNLNSFRPRPMHVRPRTGFTSGQSGNHFFAPGDIAVTYDIKSLYSAGIDGTGQSIAVVGQSAVDTKDIENFQSAAGLPKKDPVMVLVPGSGNSTVFAGDEGESDLDLEWSGAIAQGATISFVYTGSSTNFNAFDSIQYAIYEDIANIISISYGACETADAERELLAGGCVSAGDRTGSDDCSFIGRPGIDGVFRGYERIDDDAAGCTGSELSGEQPLRNRSGRNGDLADG